MGLDLSPWPTQGPYNTLGTEETSGYVVYRTSNFCHQRSAFSGFIDGLISQVKERLFSDYSPSTKDKQEIAEYILHLGIWPENSRVIVVDPAEFDPASLDSILAHFETWKISQEKPDGSAIHWKCIIYDEISKQAFQSSPSQKLGEESELGENGFLKVDDLNATTPASGYDDDNYDAFMGGERSDRTTFKLDTHKKEMEALSDSEDDEYDGFLGGSF
ncbi:hypothetical protein N7532_005340 [Penicillium argentinense]|uniref:Uncharacterized protein n=1 Tax=Penicillium argentinense TaxID=1131581 RepID=A0A9W9K9R8_9EURO|nr:uncharacterized protein N7532_005340 [Penicillium argentinense]KAJ5098339.1 hypothetical protein N7532_005340 [Penicillium argentinense]